MAIVAGLLAIRDDTGTLIGLSQEQFLHEIEVSGHLSKLKQASQIKPRWTTAVYLVSC